MNIIRGNENLNYKANWEAKSEMVIKDRVMKSKINDMKKRQATDLRARKAKLAALLAAEDK